MTGDEDSPSEVRDIGQRRGTAWQVTERERKICERTEKNRTWFKRDLISKGTLHYSPWQVRPPQVDWSDLARSIIYIASSGERAHVYDSRSRYRFFMRIISVRERERERSRGHSADRLIDGCHEPRLRISTWTPWCSKYTLVHDD